jgi:NADH-quinone oxidoreductase subunit K
MQQAFFHITVSHFLILAAVLFGIGVVGVLMRRNAIVVMMAIELMLNAANLTILAFGRMHGDMRSHSFAFVIIAVAAAEAAVGLAILVAIFRSRKTANIDELNALRN